MIGLVVVIKVCCGIPPEREIRFRVQFLGLCGLGGCGGIAVAVCVLCRRVLLGRGGGVLLRIRLGGGAVFVGYRVETGSAVPSGVLSPGCSPEIAVSFCPPCAGASLTLELLPSVFFLHAARDSAKTRASARANSFFIVFIPFKKIG